MCGLHSSILFRQQRTKPTQSVWWVKHKGRQYYGRSDVMTVNALAGGLSLPAPITFVSQSFSVCALTSKSLSLKLAFSNGHRISNCCATTAFDIVFWIKYVCRWFLWFVCHISIEITQKRLPHMTEYFRSEMTEVKRKLWDNVQSFFDNKCTLY
jgi:hypothetical protein